jgi:peptide/nickel transport system substrate-binding protein
MLTQRKSVARVGIIAATVLLLAVTWTLPAWGQAKGKNPWEVWDYPTKPVRGGYYRTAATLDVGLLNPNHWPVNDWLVINLFHEKLLITDGNFRPVPWLAESWTFPDQLTCIMKLKKGIQFSDGAPFNAQAIKFQMEWIKDPKNGCWSAGWIKPLKSVEVVDDYTVKWNFEEPWAGFLGIIANVPGYMMSPKALKEDPKKYDTHPVGTGPYILEDRSPGNWIKVKRNPNWWFGKSIGKPDMPYFDGILTTVIPDPSVQLANLRAGKIDWMTLAKSQHEMVKNDPNLQVYIGPVNHVRGYRFNHAKPPFNDLRVRQAVAYAVDRQALIAGIEFGMGRVASCQYPDDHWCHNPNLQPWPYDPKKAKQLLAEAGHSKGLTITGVCGTDPTSRARAEAVKSMLAEVGIDWKVDALDPAAGFDRFKNLEFHLTQGDWTWIYDPDLMASGLYHPTGGFNFGRSKNDAAIALIERGRKEVDMDKRQKIYWELEKVLYDNCEDIWLFWEMWPSAYSKNVMGYNFEMAVKHKEIWSWSHPLWFKDGKP